MSGWWENTSDWTDADTADLRQSATGMLAALKGLTGNPHLELGDLVYLIRDRELRGWDGPAVKAWRDAVLAAGATVTSAEGQA